MSFMYPDGSTVGQSGTGAGARSPEESPAATALPALTVLYHPDIERIGDRVFLNEVVRGGEALLSRTAPELARPDRFAGEPLRDPHLSRKPLRLRMMGTGVDAGIELRAPLLHRLAGFDIRLPPLRERRDDVGRLLIHFLRLGVMSERLEVSERALGRRVRELQLG